MKKKILLAMLAVVLIVAMSVAGTLAFLSQKTDAPLKNTFVAAGGGKIIDETGPEDPTDPDVKGFFLVEHKVEYVNNNYSAVTPEKFVKENTYDKVAPKMELFKDPMVTVNIEKEAEVYIFVKVTSTMNDALSYELTADWTSIGGGVYVYKNAVQTGGDGVELNKVQILKDNKVVVADVTTFGELTDGALGELQFCAYICQAQGFDTASAAWTACFGS